MSAARTSQRGMTLIELMVGVVLVGTLAAVAAPSFLSTITEARTLDARTELEKAARTAHAIFRAQGQFPAGSSYILPGPVGDACNYKDRQFPVAAQAWRTDTVWRALDFSVDYRTAFSFHYLLVDSNTVKITAVADLYCDGQLTTYVATVRGISDEVEAALIEQSELAAAGDGSDGDASGASSAGGTSEPADEGDVAAGNPSDGSADDLANSGDISTGGTGGTDTGAIDTSAADTIDTSTLDTSTVGSTTTSGKGNGGGGGGGGGGGNGGGKK